MNATNRDTLRSVVARQRGRARLRAATVALGAVGLVGAGAVAYTLPVASHSVSAPAAGSSTGQGTTAHTVSGGSGVTTTQTSTGSAATTGTAPTSSSGSAHTTSGGS